MPNLKIVKLGAHLRQVFPGKTLFDLGNQLKNLSLTMIVYHSLLALKFELNDFMLEELDLCLEAYSGLIAGYVSVMQPLNVVEIVFAATFQKCMIKSRRF